VNEDPRTRVLPDKVRHLEARVARLEDTVGMLEKAENRSPLSLGSKESRVLLAIVIGCSIAVVVIKTRTKDQNHA